MKRRATVWSEEPRAVPLRAWSGSALARLTAVLTEVLRAWCDDWDLPATRSGQVLCVSACDADVPGACAWLHLGEVGTASAWIERGVAEDEWLAGQWFGAARGGHPVVAAVAGACALDARQRLAAALHLNCPVDHKLPGPSLGDRWAGAVHARLPGCGRLLLEGDLVRELLAKHGTAHRHGAPAVVPLQQALRPTALHVHVDLDGCELELGELQALQVGDVLTLRHRVDAPAQVSFDDCGALLSGWLAQSRGRRAVELASTHS